MNLFTKMLNLQRASTSLVTSIGLFALLSTPILSSAQTSVDLGSAANYTILSKTGITNVSTSSITGNIAVSPIAATAITGFSLTMHSSGEYATSTQVVGNVYAADYTAPTPTLLNVAVGDMLTAYTDAAGRTALQTELHTGDLSGKTLSPGVYSWTTDVLINSDLTLSGSSTDLWIFQISQGISQAAGAQVILTGGARAANIVWQTAGSVSIGAGAHMVGTVLAGTSVSLAAGATVQGRLLANTEVVLIQNTITPPTAATSNEPTLNYGALKLEQNYPNPFNPTTTISFTIAESGVVVLTVFDMLGRQVETLFNGTKTSGSHAVTWNARNMASGMYVIRLNAAGQSVTRTMNLSK